MCATACQSRSTCFFKSRLVRRQICGSAGRQRRAVSAGAGAVLVLPLWHALLVCVLWCPSLRPLHVCHGPWSIPFLSLLMVSCSCVVSPLLPCPCWPLPATLGLFSSPCQGHLSLPLPCTCPCPFLSRCGGRGAGGRPVGRRRPIPGGGWSEATGRGLQGCGGGGGSGPRPGGGVLMPPAAWRPRGRPRRGWWGCGRGSPRRCAPCAPLPAFLLPRPTSPSSGGPARRGQTTRRGGRAPGGGRAPSSRSWSGGGGGLGWRMRTGGAGNGNLGAVRGGTGTWTWDGGGGRGGARGSWSGHGGGLGWRMRMGSAGNGNRGAVPGGRGTRTWDGSGVRGGARGSRTGGSGAGGGLAAPRVAGAAGESG